VFGIAQLDVWNNTVFDRIWCLTIDRKRYLGEQINCLITMKIDMRRSIKKCVGAFSRANQAKQGAEQTKQGAEQTKQGAEQTKQGEK